MPRMYFGHPINTYGTPLETFLIQKIAAAFPGWTIVNPGDLEHQAACERKKVLSGSAIDYCYEVLLPTCQAGVFLPFRDLAWGGGTFGEAEWLEERVHPVFQISPAGVITMAELFRARVLTGEETRRRIRTPNGATVSY